MHRGHSDSGLHGQPGGNGRPPPLQTSLLPTSFQPPPSASSASRGLYSPMTGVTTTNPSPGIGTSSHSPRLPPPSSPAHRAYSPSHYAAASGPSSATSIPPPPMSSAYRTGGTSQQQQPQQQPPHASSFYPQHLASAYQHASSSTPGADSSSSVSSAGGLGAASSVPSASASPQPPFALLQNAARDRERERLGGASTPAHHPQAQQYYQSQQYLSKGGQGGSSTGQGGGGGGYQQPQQATASSSTAYGQHGHHQQQQQQQHQSQQQQQQQQQHFFPPSTSSSSSAADMRNLSLSSQSHQHSYSTPSSSFPQASTSTSTSSTAFPSTSRSHSLNRASTAASRPSPTRCKGLQRVRDPARDLTFGGVTLGPPERQVAGRRAAPEGGWISPLKGLTTALPATYGLVNPGFKYETSRNPRRVLTKPSKPATNDGFDNEDSDYILYVNDVLGPEDGNRYVSLLFPFSLPLPLLTFSLSADDSYLILDVLGQGTFGQVVKCQNLKTHEIVAVKVVKNKPAYFQQSMMEVTILELVRLSFLLSLFSPPILFSRTLKSAVEVWSAMRTDTNPLPLQINNQWDKNDEHHMLRLKDTFIHQSHLCLVFELLSNNLYELIKQNSFRGLSTSLVRVFTAQLLDALSVLNEAKIIHCDLKPENILLKSCVSHPPLPSLFPP